MSNVRVHVMPSKHSFGGDCASHSVGSLCLNHVVRVENLPISLNSWKTQMICMKIREQPTCQILHLAEKLATNRLEWKDQNLEPVVVSGSVPTQQKPFHILF